MKYIKCEESNEHKNLLKPLLIYWIFFLVWQNFGSYTSDSMLSNVIKLGMVLYIGYAYVSRITIFKTSNLIIWMIFFGYMLVLCTSMETQFTGTVAIHYYFPVLFSLFVFVFRTDGEATKNEYKNFLKVFVISSIIMALYSMIFQFDKIVSFTGIKKTYGSELTSFFTSNHEYAMYLLFGMLSLILYYKLDNTEKSKKVFWGILALLGVNFIITLSRTAFLAASFILIVTVIFSDNVKLKKVSAILVLVIAFLLIALPQLRDFAVKIIFKERDDAGRFDMWRQSFSDFKEFGIVKQLFGSGFLNVNKYCIETYAHSTVHNMFLQTMLEYGIFGLIFLIGIFVSVIRDVLKIYKINKELSVFFIGLIFVAIAFMTTNTACIMQSSIDSYMLTVFTIVIPKFVSNAVINNHFDDESEITEGSD